MRQEGGSRAELPGADTGALLKKSTEATQNVPCTLCVCACVCIRAADMCIYVRRCGGGAE